MSSRKVDTRDNVRLAGAINQWTFARKNSQWYMIVYDTCQNGVFSHDYRQIGLQAKALSDQSKF